MPRAFHHPFGGIPYQPRDIGHCPFKLGCCCWYPHLIPTTNPRHRWLRLRLCLLLPSEPFLNQLVSRGFVLLYLNPLCLLRQPPLFKTVPIAINDLNVVTVIPGNLDTLRSHIRATILEGRPVC